MIEVACDAGEAPSDRSAPPVWLRSVTVEGFRGIGAPATLTLEPAPGLTVVVGRNGSGKSSFAEGLELLMTGRLKRWEKRPKAWTETWQCLHHEGPTRIAAELVLEGGGDVALAQEWAHGAAHDDASGRARRASRAWRARLGPRPAELPPFLSYAELATMFDTLSSLYEALTPVLGLADIDELAASLGTARLAYDNQRKTVASARDGLIARLDPDDEHAALVAAALKRPQARPRRDRPAARGRPGLQRRHGAVAPPGRAARALRRGDRRGLHRAARRRAGAARRSEDRRAAGHPGRHAAAPGARGPRPGAARPTTAPSAAPPTCSTKPGRRTRQSRRRR